MHRWVYEQDQLVVVVEVSGTSATVVWRGVSDARHPGRFLNPLTEKLTQQLHFAQVTVDVRQLEYMNSATVKPLVGLVKALDANGKSVRVLFSEVDWQRTHCNCMSAVARTLKNVSVEARPRD